MKNSPAYSFRKLKVAQLGPGIHVIIIIVSKYGARFTGENSAVHIGGSQKSPVQIDIRSLSERFCFNAVHDLRRRRNLKIHAV